MCRAPVAVRPRADAVGQLQHLDPWPARAGRWVVDPESGWCRRSFELGAVRYHAHSQSCRARFFRPWQGVCRGVDCQEVVRLYGDHARLLCDGCQAARVTRLTDH